MIGGGRRRLVGVGRTGGQRKETDGNETAEDKVFHSVIKAMAVPDKQRASLDVAGKALGK